MRELLLVVLVLTDEMMPATVTRWPSLYRWGPVSSLKSPVMEPSVTAWCL